MRRSVLLITFMLTLLTVSAQMRIGTPVADKSAQLDVVASNKGVLPTRIALTGSTDNTTINGGNVNSLLIYNTSNAGDLTPGYYYWAAAEGKWLRLATETSNLETITTWVDNGDSTYTYTSENGTQTTFEVQYPDASIPFTADIYPPIESTQALAISTATGSSTYAPDEAVLDRSWQSFAMPVTTFEVASTSSYVVFNLQGVVFAGAPLGTATPSFSVGVFIDGELKGVRVFTISDTGATHPLLNFNVGGITSGLNPGQHTVQAYALRRFNSLGTLFFGGIDPANPPADLDQFMTKAVLNLQVFNPTTP